MDSKSPKAKKSLERRPSARLPSSSTSTPTAANGEQNMGVIHLLKNTQRVHKARRSKRTNFVRQRLTKKDKAEMKFEHFEPVYKLWCDYFADMMNIKPEEDKNREVKLDDRHLKLDYHGAMLYVAEADNPTMIGLAGIVVLETRNTLQLMTESNKYIVIPKQGSTFQFVFAGHIFTLFGDAIRYQPGVRGKKIKYKMSLPFLLK